MKIKLQVVRGFVCILFDEDYEDSSKMYICFKIISMYVNEQEDETEVSFVCEDNKDRAFTFKNFSDAQKFAEKIMADIGSSRISSQSEHEIKNFSIDE